MGWLPTSGENSVSWLLWHIAEVEDNWVRSVLLGQDRRYPFGSSVRDAAPRGHPRKTELLSYFDEVRAMTRQRLEATSGPEFGRMVNDPQFEAISLGAVWSGVATSFA